MKLLVYLLKNIFIYKMSESESEFSDDEFLEQLQKKRIIEIKKSQKIEESQYKPSKYWISGPHALKTMQKGDIIVHLFGEYHTPDKTCQDEEIKRGIAVKNIDNYISEILKANKKMIDFYIEAPVIHLQPIKLQKRFYEHKTVMSAYERDIPFLVKIRDQVKWCLKYETRDKCSYKNVRVHSTDLRPFEDLSNMASRLRLPFTETTFIQFKEQYKNTIKELSDVKNCEQYTMYILNRLKSKKIFLKQLKKTIIINLKHLKIVISDLCKKTNAIYYLMEFLNIVNSDIPPVGLIFDQKSTDILQNQLSILHDVYTFLRMIRPFDSKPQKTIIFYGGLAHMENLKYMFEAIKFKEKKNTSKTINKGCLELVNFDI